MILNRNIRAKCILLLSLAVLLAGAAWCFVREPARPADDAVLVQYEEEGQNEV